MRIIFLDGELMDGNDMCHLSVVVYILKTDTVTKSEPFI